MAPGQRPQPILEGGDWILPNFFHFFTSFRFLKNPTSILLTRKAWRWMIKLQKFHLMMRYKNSFLHKPRQSVSARWNGVFFLSKVLGPHSGSDTPKCQRLFWISAIDLAWTRLIFASSPRWNTLVRCLNYVHQSL